MFYTLRPGRQLGWEIEELADELTRLGALAAPTNWTAGGSMSESWYTTRRWRRNGGSARPTRNDADSPIRKTTPDSRLLPCRWSSACNPQCQGLYRLRQVWRADPHRDQESRRSAGGSVPSPP